MWKHNHRLCSVGNVDFGECSGFGPGTRCQRDRSFITTSELATSSQKPLAALRVNHSTCVASPCPLLLDFFFDLPSKDDRHSPHCQFPFIHISFSNTHAPPPGKSTFPRFPISERGRSLYIHFDHLAKNQKGRLTTCINDFVEPSWSKSISLDPFENHTFHTFQKKMQWSRSRRFIKNPSTYDCRGGPKTP